MTGALKVQTSPGTWQTIGGVGLPGPTGPTGSAGAPGAKWFTQAGAPAGATGIVGDFSIDTVTSDFYEKTGASAWTLRGNLKGIQGSQGVQGVPGPMGDWTAAQVVPAPITTTSIAPAPADVGKLFLLNSTSSHTITLPSDATSAIATGCRIDYVRYNTGSVSFTGGSGATYFPVGATIRARYSAATAIKIVANGWLVVGDLA